MDDLIRSRLAGGARRRRSCSRRVAELQKRRARSKILETLADEELAPRFVELDVLGRAAGPGLARRSRYSATVRVMASRFSLNSALRGSIRDSILNMPASRP